MQQFLKPAAGVAWARVIATQLLDEFLVPVYDAEPALDLRFGRESLAAFTGGLESRMSRCGWFWFS